MSRKNKIIVSIVGISIISLALIGLTYGYYLTRIQGNTNNKSISISTANLELTYSDNSDIITGTNIVPGTTLGTKTFTVTNSGDNNVDSYSVGLLDGKSSPALNFYGKFVMIIIKSAVADPEALSAFTILCCFWKPVRNRLSCVFRGTSQSKNSRF